MIAMIPTKEFELRNAQATATMAVIPVAATRVVVIPVVAIRAVVIPGAVILEATPGAAVEDPTVDGKTLARTLKTIQKCSRCFTLRTR